MFDAMMDQHIDDVRLVYTDARRLLKKCLREMMVTLREQHTHKGSYYESFPGVWITPFSGNDSGNAALLYECMNGGNGTIDSEGNKTIIHMVHDGVYYKVAYEHILKYSISRTEMINRIKELIIEVHKGYHQAYGWAHHD